MLAVCDVFTHSANVLRRILQRFNRNEATSTGQYPYQLVKMNTVLLPVQSTVRGVPSFEGHATECAMNKH
jgi:hypothetical protein